MAMCPPPWVDTISAARSTHCDVTEIKTQGGGELVSQCASNAKHDGLKGAQLHTLCQELSATFSNVSFACPVVHYRDQSSLIQLMTCRGT